MTSFRFWVAHDGAFIDEGTKDSRKALQDAMALWGELRASEDDPLVTIVIGEDAGPQ